MTDKRPKATKVKCKRNESLTKQSIFVEYSLLQRKHLSFTGAHSQMNTTLFQKLLTRRNVKLSEFAFGTPWLLDLLCKNWFTSSVWNFCRWVADVPPCETSLNGNEREETSAVRRLFLGWTSVLKFCLLIALHPYVRLHPIWMVQIRISDQTSLKSWCMWVKWPPGGL